ncbi:unnamed protein product [Lactuca saligna]|uniref:Uncharacterized protein n=1 Tax=Lactuca saligna TaxID=75948 RepID=A0AA35ZDK7_LACSI|nr:unnamed protein product [Lactuca saligna]
MLHLGDTGAAADSFPSSSFSSQITSFGLWSDTISYGLRSDAINSGLRFDAASSGHRSGVGDKVPVSSGLRSDAVFGLRFDAVGKAQYVIYMYCMVCGSLGELTKLCGYSFSFGFRFNQSNESAALLGINGVGWIKSWLLEAAKESLRRLNMRRKKKTMDTRSRKRIKSEYDWMRNQVGEDKVEPMGKAWE